ncbi:MAG: hypothetical protein FWB91_03245 [Defluviitaleaceae bacterium]|nr:hypothetical protein [Defluviitaleaceae bacterium]
MWVYIEERGWKIIMADGLVTFAIVTAILWNLTDIHNAICFIIGLASAILLGMFFCTSVGFWIVSIIFSVIWSIIPALIAGFITDFDNIWMGAVGLVSFIICMVIHVGERN